MAGCAIVAACDFNEADFRERMQAGAFELIIAADAGFAHLEEAAAVLEEGAVDHLVGGIDDTRHVAALSQCLVGHCQTAELLEVGLEKLQMLGLEEIQPIATQRQPTGERERILDGQPHVGYAELRLDGTVLELYGAMDD